MTRILGLLTLVGIFYTLYDAFRNQRYMWIFGILFFPGLGALLYFILIMLPQMRTQEFAEQASESIESFFFPEKELQELEERVEMAPSFQNKIALSEAYQRAGRFEDALAINESLVQGYAKKDAKVWKGIAYAYFHLGQYGRVPAAIEKMKLYRSGNKPTEFDLLLPMALEKMGNFSAAEIEYGVLADTFNGEEARCRFAQFLQTQGKNKEAREIYEEMLQYAKTSPPYYKQAQKQWLNIARRELKVLS